MSFLRHVGKHGDRKVAVIFREVPNEPHMCLVTYTETLNQHIHDPLIKCIESDIGQHSENLADALNRTYGPDGRPLLVVLHVESQLKKVQTSQIVMTPQPNTKIKLDELNKILDEMQQGEAAVKRLAEMNDSRGLQDPADVVRRMRGNKEPIIAGKDALGDVTLATQRLEQALKMEKEAHGLLAESARLTAEAHSLNPALTPEKSKKVKKSEVIQPIVETPVKRAYVKKIKVGV